MGNEFYNGNGVWIPYEILQSEELSSTEKILYAEIFYLDRPDTHCTASNEHLSKFLGISEAGLKKCLQHLRDLGYIYTASFDGRKRSIATYVKYRNEVDTKVSTSEIQEYPSEVYKNENLLLIENKKENSRESTGAGALAKHPRNFSKNILTDDLQSGKDIDEQKKIKKKTSEHDKCLAEIDKRYDDPNIYSAVLNHLEWSYNSKDPNRIKTLKTFVKRLDELDKLILGRTTDVAVKIIQQSIDKKWHCFYEIREGKSYSKNTIDNAEITSQKSRTDEEIEQLLAQRLERNGIV